MKAAQVRFLYAVDRPGLGLPGLGRHRRGAAPDPRQAGAGVQHPDPSVHQGHHRRRQADRGGRASGEWFGPATFTDDFIEALGRRVSGLHDQDPAGRTGLPPAPRLAVEGVTMTFGSDPVLRDVAIEVVPDEIHALIGQNGSGKSTLAKVLTGLYCPDAGSRVAVDGVAAAAADPARTRPAPTGCRGRAPEPRPGAGRHRAGEHAARPVRGLALPPPDRLEGRGRGDAGRLRATRPAQRAARHQGRGSAERRGPRTSRSPGRCRTFRTAAELIIFDESTRALGRRVARAVLRPARPHRRDRHLGAAHHAPPRGGRRRPPTGSPCCATARSSWPARMSRA